MFIIDVVDTFLVSTFSIGDDDDAWNRCFSMSSDHVTQVIHSWISRDSTMTILTLPLNVADINYKPGTSNANRGGGVSSNYCHWQEVPPYASRFLGACLRHGFVGLPNP